MKTHNSYNNSFFCTKPWTSFEINDHKGNIKPCCWSVFSCGNINNSSIEDIWNNLAYQDMRKFMIKGQLDAICAIDCPYRVGEHQDIKYPKPFSEIFTKNKLLQLKEIKEKEIILKSKPTIMSIVPSIECNRHCSICYLNHNDSVELPSEIFSIIESYFPVLQELWIVGGEPLISKRCLNLIETIDNDLYPDLHLGLITNGTCISKEVFTLLNKVKISWILVSIDAAKESTYRKIRGGNLNNIIDNVKILKSIRDKQKKPWNLKIGFIIMKSNIDELFKFVDLAVELDVNVQFAPIFGNNHNESFYEDITLMNIVRTSLLELGNYLERNGMRKIRINRVSAKIDALLLSKQIKNSNELMFFDGDESIDYEKWRNLFIDK
ncbi:MAG: radical SAM protein [Promethearchaeota archaeon]